MPELSMLNVSASVNIRAFSRDDVKAILEIQKLCKPAPAWRIRDYEQLADNPCGMVLVAKLEGCIPSELQGFCAAYRMGKEAELWNIAVAPRHRRQGVAKSLIHEVFRRLAGVGVHKLFLEVRRSNTHAINLYRSLGFTQLLTRRDYYQNPEEDALVLVREIARLGA